MAVREAHRKIVSNCHYRYCADLSAPIMYDNTLARGARAHAPRRHQSSVKNLLRYVRQNGILSVRGRVKRTFSPRDRAWWRVVNAFISAPACAVDSRLTRSYNSSGLTNARSLIRSYRVAIKNDTSQCLLHYSHSVLNVLFVYDSMCYRRLCKKKGRSDEKESELS